MIHTYERIFELLGPFWFDIYEDGDILRSVVRANVELYAQQQQELDYIRDCASLAHMPLGKLRQWKLLPLMERKMDGNRERGYAFYLPGCIKLPLLMNRMTDASLVLFDEIDYKVRFDELIFKENPLENPLIATEPTPECGKEFVTGYLWAFRGEWDQGDLYHKHGRALGIEGVTSERYRRQLLAVTAVLKYPSLGTLSELVASLLDTPLAKTDGEVVQNVSESHTGPLVVTDHNVYRIPRKGVLSVSEGSVLKRGDQLLDDFEIVESCKHDSIVSKGADIPLRGNFIIIKLKRYCRIDEDLIQRVLPPGLILNIYRDW